MFVRILVSLIVSVAVLSCQATHGPNVLNSSKITPIGLDKESYDVAAWNRIQEAKETNFVYLQTKLSVDDARHLLQRSGMGAHPHEILALVGKSRSKAISKLISGFSTNTTLQKPQFISSPIAPYWIQSDYDQGKRQAFNMARDLEMADYRLWWIREMIETPSPQTERMVLFWHNHFVSSYSSINHQSIAIARQNVLFRSLGMTNFRTLTKSIIRDPAMLNYLDNNNNTKGKPNENLGRELMELFTIGEGNYNEDTVKEAARALTGYSVNRLKGLSFQISKYNQDNRVKSLFGQHGNFNGDKLVDILLEQPETANFIVEKFWRNFVSETNYHEAEIADIAEKFRKSDYDLKTLYRAIFTTRTFWSPQVRGTIVKSPVDMLIGTIRSTGFLPADWTSIPLKLEKLGQNLFEAPNVAGWPGGYAWVTPSRLLSRQNIMSDFFDTEGTLIQSMMESTASSMMQRRDILVVRYGAEDFQGPPNFRINLYKDKNAKKLVWRSKVLIADGGHNTQLNGRIKNDTGIPWQTMYIDFPYKGKFKAASVQFMNDHCCGLGGPEDGDRNLFVDWLKVSDRVFFANKGKQKSGCAPKYTSEAGHLYCRGHVFMSDSLSLSEELDAPEIPKDRLVVERVALNWLDKFEPRNDWSSFSVSLLNPAFNNIELEAMVVRFVRVGKGDIQLRLSDNKCHPNCFGSSWPIRPRLNKWGNVVRKEIHFPLRTGGRGKDFSSLAMNNKAFVNAIWASFPQMLEEMKKGRRWREYSIVKDRYSDWNETINYILEILPKTRYVTDSIENPLIIKAPTKQNGMMRIESGKIEPPRPAGYSPIMLAAQWNDLLVNSLASVEPSSILLAHAPLSANVAEKNIKNLVTDLSYNLK